METSQYRYIFERKMHEVFEALELDPKRALKIIQKEIDTRAKKIEPMILGSLRVVRAMVLDKCKKVEEAREEILGVLAMIRESKQADHYLLDTLQRTAAGMTEGRIFMDKYLELVEFLQGLHPDDKEITFALYEGSLNNNKFAKAAKMAAKMVQQFGEASFSLPQVQCLYMDSQKRLGGSCSPISLQLAIAFAEKYMAANQDKNEEDAPIPYSFAKLYLKLLLAKKDFVKAQNFLKGPGARSFELWVELRTWQFRIFYESGEMEKACQELTEMIRYNYTQVEQDFQSIYNLHEVLLSIALPMVPAIKDKTLSLEQLKSLVGDTVISPDALFPDFAPTTDFLKALNASFAHQGDSFEGVKTVNALNCRKSGILSQMLLRHKILALQSLKPSQGETDPLFKDLMVKYCSVFTTTPSLIFDLAPYMEYLNEFRAPQQQSLIIDLFKTQLESAGDDQVKKARLHLNKSKMERVLGHFSEATEPKVQELASMYLEYSKLDGKPEKGERKIADDFVLILTEVLDDVVSTENRQETNVSQVDLFRIGLLEYALLQSPYNFDIQLALAKIYDSNGLSVQFKQALSGLGIKGVQQESMGYLQLRHSLEWGQTDSLFKPSYLKYQKYVEFNQRDLKNLKHKSFQADNWDQVENFIEYEAFLKSSYFEQLSMLTNRITDQVKASSSNVDAAKECYIGTSSQIAGMTEAFSKDATKLNRTQDIKIILPKFSIASDNAITLQQNDALSQTFVDELNQLVIDNDPIYSKYKYARQTNFKPNVTNTLGIFDNEAVFKKVISQINTVSQMYAGESLSTSSTEESKGDEESKEPMTASSALSHILFSEDEMTKFDYAGDDQKALAGSLLKINQMLQGVINMYQALKSVVKVDGQPAVETAKQVLAKVAKPLEDLVHVITDQSSGRSTDSDRIGSPIALKEFFVEMLVYGGVIVPALDALSLKLKATVPSFKKKKGGANAAEVDQVQNDIWNAFKKELKLLQTAIEKQASLINAKMADRYAESTVVATAEDVPYLTGDDVAPVLAMIREKASEMSREKAACAERASQVSQVVCKQIKGIIDSRLK